jgi:hypothetical protein
MRFFVPGDFSGENSIWRTGMYFAPGRWGGWPGDGAHFRFAKDRSKMKSDGRLSSQHEALSPRSA